jgi:hypothetical protein
MISQAKSCASTTVPARAVLAEVVTWIFELVLDTQSYSFDSEINKGVKVSRLRYPELLSHVCSCWRQIAVSSHSLWSHIDLVPFQLLQETLIARSQVLTARAGHPLLNVHVLDVLTWTKALKGMALAAVHW